MQGQELCRRGYLYTYSPDSHRVGRNTADSFADGVAYGQRLFFFLGGMNAMEICRIPSRILVKRLTNTTGSSSPANVPRSCYPRTKWLPGINGSRDSLSWDRMTPRNCCPRTEWLPGIDGSRESLSWDQMIPRNYCPRTKWLPAISSLIQGFGINGYLSDSQEVFPGKPYLIDINLPR